MLAENLASVELMPQPQSYAYTQFTVKHFNVPYLAVE